MHGARYAAGPQLCLPHRSTKKRKGWCTAGRYVLGCLCRLVKVGQGYFTPPPPSVVYTNAGPSGLNNKWGGESLLSLSTKFGVLISLIPPGICLWIVYDDTAVCCFAPLSKKTLPKPLRTWLLISFQIPYRLIRADLPWKGLMGTRTKNTNVFSAFSSLTESIL